MATGYFLSADQRGIFKRKNLNPQVECVYMVHFFSHIIRIEGYPPCEKLILCMILIRIFNSSFFFQFLLFQIFQKA